MNLPLSKTLLPAALLVAAAILPGEAAAEGDTLPDHASPSVCVVIINLALQASVVPGEKVAAYRAAEAGYRQHSIKLNEGKNGSDQMIGSSVSFYDELGNDDLRKGAEMCLAAASQTFSADD